jgi:hypothetical protein
MSNSHTPQRHILLRNQRMSIRILRQIPNLDTPRLITTNDIPLIRMHDDITHRRPMREIPLNVRRPQIPDLDRPVFGRGGHPFGLEVEGYARDVGGVPVKRVDWVGVVGGDVVETDVGVSCCCEEAFIGGDGESVYLLHCQPIVRKQSVEGGTLGRVQSLDVGLCGHIFRLGLPRI